MNPQPFEELTQTILARTSGSPCRRLEALACELADGTLPPAQAALAQGHLEHCPACRALLASLAELSAVLPALAQVEPGAAFTAEVLEATLPVPLPSFKTTWLRLMRRPRICLEAAYLGTVAGVLTLSVPHPALHAKAEAALVAQFGRPLARVSPALQSTRSRVQACERQASQTVSQGAGRVRTFWGQVVATLRGWLSWLSAKN